MKKIILYGLLGFLIIFLVILTILYFWPDKSNVNDNDLQVSKREIVDEQNSYIDLFQAQNLMLKDKTDASVINDYLKGIITENSEIKKYLVENQQALMKIESGMEKEYFYNTKLSVLNNLQNDVGMRVPKLVLVKIKGMFDKGQKQDALQYAIKLYRLGKLIEGEPNSLVQKSIGTSIKKQVNDLVLVLNGKKLNSQELDVWQKVLNDYSYNSIDDANGWKIEYMTMKDGMNKNIRYGLNRELCNKIVGKKLAGSFCFLSNFGYYWQPNVTIGYLADMTRYNINNLDKIEQFRPYKPNFSIVDGLFGDYRTENIVGKTWMTYYLASVGSDWIRERTGSVLFQEKAYKIILILKKYELSNGKLPATLEVIGNSVTDLSDPFDGKMLRYNYEQKKIYSVGKNLQDDGGDEKLDEVISF